MCPWSGFLTSSFHIIYPRAMSLSIVFMLVFITVAVSVHLGDSCLWLFHLSVLMSLFNAMSPVGIYRNRSSVYPNEEPILTQHINYFA